MGRSTFSFAAAVGLLLLGGCSGSPWYSRVVSEPGVTVTYNEAFFRDLEFVLRRCANPIVVTPGMSQLVGAETLVPGCMRAGDLDRDRLVEGLRPSQRQRVVTAATVMALLTQPLDPPVPSELRELSFDTRDLAAKIPILGEQLLKLDQAQRTAGATLSTAAQGVVMLPGALCEFHGTAAVALTNLKLRNARFAWRRTGLVMTADLDSQEPQATAEITTSIPCMGSSDNPAHALLKIVVPDGSRTILLSDATLEMSFDFRVKLPQDSAEQPRLEITPRQTRLAVGRLTVGGSGSPGLDAASDTALRQFGFDAQKLAQLGSQALEPAARGIARALEQFVFESIDLEENPELKLKLAGVEFVETRPGVNRRMRFVAFRTDKVCTLRSGGRIVDGRFQPGEAEWICVDPSAKPSGECQRINGREICWKPPFGGGPNPGPGPS